MAKTCVSASIIIDSPAADAWKMVKDFGGVAQWVPDIAQCVVKGAGVGAERTLTQTDGARVVERLENINDSDRTLNYRIVESTLPVEDYSATLRVRDLGVGRCEVEWVSSLDPKGVTAAEAKKLLMTNYTRYLERLKDLVTKKHERKPLTLLVALRSKKGMEQRLREVLTKLMASCRAEDGCLTYNVHQSLDDPSLFEVYMRWRDTDAFDHHIQNPLVLNFDAELADLLLREPYKSTHWQLLEEI